MEDKKLIVEDEISYVEDKTANNDVESCNNDMDFTKVNNKSMLDEQQEAKRDNDTSQPEIQNASSHH